MIQKRAAKIDGIANDIPDQKVEGEQQGDLLVLGWGSTYGAIKSAVDLGTRTRILKVSHAHLRYIHPFPKNLGEVLGRFKHVLIPEINNGQLIKLIRDEVSGPGHRASM